jgi:hypothetical protein
MEMGSLAGAALAGSGLVSGPDVMDSRFDSGGIPGLTPRGYHLFCLGADHNIRRLKAGGSL